jgi:hypothetical protein
MYAKAADFAQESSSAIWVFAATDLASGSLRTALANFD